MTESSVPSSLFVPRMNRLQIEGCHNKVMDNRSAKAQPKANQQWGRQYELAPEECLIGKLSDEIWIRIFKLVNMRELISLQSCCLRFAELARDNVLWLPFCRKHVVDQEGALLLACRRKAAALEEAREEAVAKLKKKELERGKGTENEDSAILLGELGGGWVVMVIKDEAPKPTEREKEREEMRKMAEAKKRAKLPPTSIDKITTPWWDEFTPEEEEFETNRGSYEKPLWKEVFAAWKIARDFKMLHRCAHCSEYYYQKDNHPKACQYSPGDPEYSWRWRVEPHKSLYAPPGLSEFVEE